MRIFREHPAESSDPERRATVRIRRIAAAVGGIITGTSAIMISQTETYTDERFYSNGGFVLGVSTLSLVAFSELQERYRSGGHGGRGKQWEPDEPQEPDDPGGSGIEPSTDWDMELQELLTREAVSV